MRKLIKYFAYKLEDFLVIIVQNLMCIASASFCMWRLFTKKLNKTLWAVIVGKYSIERTYKNHKEIHEGSVFACQDCPKQFSSLHFLKEHHRKIHDVKRIQKCQFCEKLFACKQNLKKHQKSLHSKNQ